MAGEIRQNDMGLFIPTGKLEQALTSLLGHNKSDHSLAQTLAYTSRDRKGRISYEIIDSIAKDDTEEVLFLCYEWRLLVPVRTSVTIDWENSVLLAKSGEIYKMPNIIVNLVKYAIKTGCWDTEYAIIDCFSAIHDPSWSKMAAMIGKMFQVARYHRINAIQIREIADELSLCERVDPLIAEFKAAGIMNPKLSLMTEMLRVRAPIYELNPSLFPFSS
jgi:hypothetical protein